MIGRTLFGLLIGMMYIIFLFGCDKGRQAPVPKTETRIRIRIERMISAELNDFLTVWAQDMRQHTDSERRRVISITCPCFIGPTIFGPSVAIKEDKLLSLELLSGAEYNVSVEYTETD